ncbi:MAG: MFS transporter, partial [Chlamydiae bacterium]|nr:MFS transporter [Chlamydiota bacterium]
MTKKSALSVLYFSAFIDYAGVAIVFTLFTFLLFDPTLHFLPFGTSDATRGLVLAILTALHPLAQFFSAPICGVLSDKRGRKSLMKSTVLLQVVGYSLAVFAVISQNIWLLVLYRLLTGIGAGNSSVIAAMVGDLSTPENKAKHFGLLSMSMALGFIVAPLFSSLLSAYFGILVPFCLPLALVILNYILVRTKLQESLVQKSSKKLSPFVALTMIRRSFDMKHLRFVFLAHLLFSIGWSFFVEFNGVFLRAHFAFSAVDMGLFYGYGALFYAFSAALFILPMVKRFGATRVLFLGLLLSGLSVLGMLTFHSRLILWLYV